MTKILFLNINITGNELANKVVKEATEEKYLYRLPLVVEEFNYNVKRKVIDSWQNKCDKDWNNKKHIHVTSLKIKLKLKLEKLYSMPHQSNTKCYILTNSIIFIKKYLGD